MNDRGVTVLLGFILLMMISITFLSVVQTYYVPSILKDRELKHNDEILSSLIDLTSALTKERPNVIELNLGVEYPKYLFLMTPSTGSGTISAENFNISLEYNETYPEQRYNSTKFQTQRILVTLNYYVNPRTIFIYENTAIFKKPGNITVAEQSVFQRGRITLILINSSIGSLSANYPLDLAVVPVSYGGEVLAKNVTIEFESVNPQHWESLENRGYTVKVDGKKVRIEAENVTLSINYVYITAGLGVSIEQAQEIYASNLKPSRIVKVTYPQLKEISVSEGQSVTLGVRVLDRFNNPLRGVYVTSNKGSGYTDSKGEFYVTFTALSDEVVTFSVNDLSVTYNISVVSGGGGVFDVSWNVSSYDWNVSEEGPIKSFKVKVLYSSNPVEGAIVDISTDNPIVGYPESVTTNENGEAIVDLTALDNGTTHLFATVGGVADILELSISGVVGGFCPIGWSYWREITITNPDGDLTDYQIRIELDGSNFDFSHAKSDGSDIRFYDSDGVTPLSYWIEEWDDDHAVIWVKVPSIPSGGKKIYMFYGNLSAESESNGEATFDFFDDFETFDTVKWKAYSVDYSVSNGVLTIRYGGIERTEPFSFRFQDGYITETRVKFIDRWFGGYSGVIPEVASSPYTASDNRNKDATILYMREYHQTEVYYWIGDGRGRGYDYYGYVWNSKNNKWYVTGVSVLNGEVKFWKDYQVVKKIEGIKWKKDLKYIKLGSSHRNSFYNIQDTSYDWVRVRKYADPEPSVSVGSEHSC